MYIKITTDSACDLGEALLKKYDVSVVPMTVQIGERSGRDGVDVFPREVYDHVAAGGELPCTSAPNVGTYTDFFGALSGQYEAVIHISLSSGLSSAYQNACIAAADFPNVYVVDSANLSTGFGHVVLEAALLAQTTLKPQEILGRLSSLVPRVRTSFILGRLDYMKKGGRCSSIAALGANLLKLKPMLSVVNGKLGVTKKYRGTMERVLRDYVADQLRDREDLVRNRIFITHSAIDPALVEIVREEVKKYADFHEILETSAGCTIGSHCGPECLGILYIVK